MENLKNLNRNNGFLNYINQNEEVRKAYMTDPIFKKKINTLTNSEFKNEYEAYRLLCNILMSEGSKSLGKLYIYKAGINFTKNNTFYEKAEHDIVAENDYKVIINDSVFSSMYKSLMLRGDGYCLSGVRIINRMAFDHCAPSSDKELYGTFWSEKEDNNNYVDVIDEVLETCKDYSMTPENHSLAKELYDIKKEFENTI